MAAPNPCPCCGSFVPDRAAACPECGACEESGWSDASRFGAAEADIPDLDFDYDDFIRREFEGGGDRIKPRGVSWIWWCVALAVLLLFLGRAVF